jgi:opacity protein-like surface antigen
LFFSKPLWSFQAEGVNPKHILEITSMVRSCMKFAGALAIVLGLVSASYAQDKDDVIRPLTKSGSAAMVFTLSGFGTFGVGAPGIGTLAVPTPNGITAFNTTNQTIAGVGGKYFLSDDMALRFLLAFGTQSSGADTVNGGAISATQFGIAAGLEWHMRPLYSTSPYVGAQVGYGMASVSSQVKVAGSDVTNKGSASVLGVSVFGGFDWFFTRGMAIGAEYALGFSTTSSSTTAGTNASVSAPSATAIGLGLNGGANVHCIVYF